MRSMSEVVAESLVAALCGAGAIMAYGVRARSSTLFGPSVYHGSPSRNAIALTFDDGPSESTPALLKILDEHQAQATFFQCGANVDRLGEVARAVARGGHEIGNHTYSHQPLYLHSSGFIEDEVTRAQESIVKITRVKPTLFRAPFGARWPGLATAQRKLGLSGVMWTVIGRDWKLSADAIVARVMRGIRNGAIICLHDGRKLQTKPEIGETLQAVGRLIPLLKARGYRLETVSQLLCPRN
jgi:peptidoglycan/xylan/chitin deacetylase (PgdA/CDA1 family)